MHILSSHTLFSATHTGAFGSVYKGSLHGETVAIKTLRATKIDRRVLKDFKEEISIMAHLRHRHLIALLGACWKDGPDKLCLVLEFAGRGSFADCLKDELMGWWHPFKQICEGVASCLSYLHEGLDKRVIHRDLKPSNVLVDGSLHAKVADFGTSRTLGEDSMMLTTFAGTPQVLCSVAILFDMVQFPHNHELFACSILNIDQLTVY